MRAGNLESYHAPLSFVILFGVTFATCKIAFSLLAAGLFRSGGFPDLLRNRRLGREKCGRHESFSLVSPYSSVSRPQGDSPLTMGKGIPYLGGGATQNRHCFSVGG